MRHRVVKNSFSRRNGPRKALLRGLVNALVENGRIKTTLRKAKVTRSKVEKAITRGKEDTVHNRRILSAHYPNKNTVLTVFNDLSQRFKDRPGGYTRIIKLGPRPGDNAPMAYIEFVDFDPTKKGRRGALLDQSSQLNQSLKLRKKKRKTQEKSRIINRQLLR